MSQRAFRGALFDLDGTLVDSAPDLVGTLNDMRCDRGLAVMPYRQLRSHATRGALGLLGVGFSELSAADREEMRVEFIERYRERLWRDSAPFAGIESVLDRLISAGVRLGIVTNKIESLARPLVEQAGWHHIFGTIIGGDSTPRSKPDPGPVLTACSALGLSPAECIFVGDDQRDVQAGKAAGTATIAVNWGYIEPADQPTAWGADHVVDQVEQLTHFFDLDPSAKR